MSDADERLTPSRIVHRTPHERAALGKAARERRPLAGIAAYDGAGRPDPVAVLEQQAITRVPDLVPIRYGRMAVSPFAFYRGAALIMAGDLARSQNSGLQVQLCGDAHLSNFGTYASPLRRLVFDINDFDETHPGPFEWDVLRLGASLAVINQENGYPAKKSRRIVMTAAAAYREQMREFASAGNLAVWYSHLDLDGVMGEIGKQLDKRLRASAEANLAKARGRDNLHALAKLTTVVDGQARIVSQPPLVVPVEELWAQETSDRIYDDLRALVRSYRRTLQWDRRHLLEQYTLRQAARKVVGVGSVGTRAFILLLEGLDGGDPLFLQAKEAQPSVLSGFTKPSGFKNQGQRVVTGQQLMQAVSDILLGWQRVDGADGVQRDFYVRQLRDGKGTVDVERLTPEGMTVYAGICGQTLARAHARSGDRVAIAAYLGSSDRFETAVADFAQTYAEQNAQDHAALQSAIADGVVTAQMGV